MYHTCVIRVSLLRDCLEFPATMKIGKEGNILFNDKLNIFYSYHMNLAFQLAAEVLLYTPSQRQDSTYDDFCYTNRGTLAGTKNSSMCSS